MVSASAKVVPILVDCTQQGAHANLLATYQVRGFPTLLFVGPEGETLFRPMRRDAEVLVQLMDQLGQNAAGGSRSKWPAFAILAAVAIAVPCILVLVYKKWFAGAVEDES